MMKQMSEPTTRICAIDLFAGVGGSSAGATMAGIQIVAAVDTWTLARDTYLDNYPEVLYFKHRCETFDIRRLDSIGKRIDLLIASPECTNHTCAKGSAIRSEESRRTAFQVVRFAREIQPKWIVVENVVSMRSWDRYYEWIASLIALGYNIRVQVLNASDFGVPQNRKRLFIMCDRETVPSKVVPPANIRPVAASTIINPNGLYRFTPLCVPKRAIPTLQRANRAFEALGKSTPFLLVYYGSDGAGGWQRVSVPLRTITTIDRFAFVRPSHDGHEMRMLQVAELKAAMGFPPHFKTDRGTRRDQIKLLGNAVCPQVMKAVVAQVTTSRRRDGRI